MAVVVLALACLAAGGVLAQEADTAAALENPVEATAESIAEGAALYARRCAGCHGADGAGGLGPNLVDDEYAHGASDGEIFDVIRNGVPPAYAMEPFGDRLDETDTWHVVNYLRSLQAP